MKTHKRSITSPVIVDEKPSADAGGPATTAMVLVARCGDDALPSPETDPLDKLCVQIADGANVILRSERVWEAKGIYEERNPSARRGGSRKQTATVAVGFAQYLASRTGRSERSIMRDARIAKGLSEATRAALRDTPVKEESTVLEKIATRSEGEQERLVAAFHAEGDQAMRALLGKMWRGQERETVEADHTEKCTAIATTEVVPTGEGPEFSLRFFEGDARIIPGYRIVLERIETGAKIAPPGRSAESTGRYCIIRLLPRANGEGDDAVPMLPGTVLS